MRSGFFNSVNGDRKYDASRFAEYFASFIGNGVFPNPASGLQVMAQTIPDMTVIVRPGKAWINGYILINDDDYILQLDPADGVLNRIDRVVARYDTDDREIRLEVKKGTFASSPVAPALQRDADAYELGIADIAVNAGAVSILQANITDLRNNSELCGRVDSLIAGDIQSLADALNSHLAESATYTNKGHLKTGDVDFGTLKGELLSYPYILPGWSVSITPGNSFSNNGEIMYIPIHLSEDTLFSGIMASAYAGVADSSIEVRIYEKDEVTTLPSTEVVNAGVIDTSTSGKKEIAISFTLQKGNFFIGVRFTGSPNIRGFQPNNAIKCPIDFVGEDTGGGYAIFRTIYSVTGVMNDPATAPSGFTTSSYVPLIVLKRSV